MFTGFASENTPALKVWNFFRFYTGTASVSLENDCAPLQLFKTGGSSSDINLYLPASPVEGKIIRIQNMPYAQFVNSGQSILVFSSDGGGTSPIITIGNGSYLEFIYSKDFISVGQANGTVIETGWVTLNQSPRSAYNYNAISAGNNCRAAERSAIAMGGDSGIARGVRSSVIGGSASTASGSNAGVFSSENSTATNSYSVVVGGANNSASGVQAGTFV
jgi:hypothetical protein